MSRALRLPRDLADFPRRLVTRVYPAGAATQHVGFPDDGPRTLMARAEDLLHDIDHEGRRREFVVDQLDDEHLHGRHGFGRRVTHRIASFMSPFARAASGRNDGVHTARRAAAQRPPARRRGPVAALRHICSHVGEPTIQIVTIRVAYADTGYGLVTAPAGSAA